MTNERLIALLAYMDALTRLQAGGSYTCRKEIAECIGWIREELFGKITETTQ